ncbi:MAG: 50S ribosomal protein L10 [Candidatus Thalassarchaeaceae archaeon]|nr:50S ribosomal protein L10 [Euryarchaeota archaeon]MDG1553636.1 50S ribosomal protein L10 [Candidatus Thalassarchaeaceae archaeon]DAC61770.1 MAG TPA: 50S ribosomal protein L10 [Candidatus Poseidoniales archaeon]HII13147.1 50S ribosomal protein L10 [Candidatus Thalassarchaeaceae archaeon]
MIAPKIAPWKKDRVGELTDVLNSDGVVGIVDVGGVPASNMLDMRSNLRDSMKITMAKKTLIRLAWENSGRSNEELETLMEGAVQPCIVQSENLNPFELFIELEKTRQGRAAKEGELAPMDIIVEKGPTTFGPGPIVGEFNAVGIPAKIDKGKVAIQKTTTVVEKGEPISADLGIMLAKLDINPIEIGIILTGAIEEGFFFPASALNIDLDQVRTDIITATSGAFNLACNVRWFSEQTMPTLLSKASGEALSVAVEAGVTNETTAPLFISRANARALALAGQLDSSALDEELSAALGAAASAASESVAASNATETVTEVTDEEEEEEEEQEFGGLGDLFG